MKKTALHSIHIASGAKMGEFAGFDMPLFYPLGVMKEHLHTRSKAGLFDISHMVHVEVSGKQAPAFIDRLCPYETASQQSGEAKYTFFLNETGKIIDDLIVTRLGSERFLIVANAGCAEKDVEHIRHHADAFDVVIDVLPRGFVALQGPSAEAVLESAGLKVAGLDFMNGYEPEAGWFVSRTGYTGEDGFEIAMPEADCIAFTEKLMAHEDVELIGLGARDSLRLEAGLSLYGQDLDETISPLEAGLIWAIPKSLRVDGSFLGAQALADEVAAGRSRMRVGLLPDGRPVRAQTSIVNEADESVGMVTSGGFGPTLSGPMALGMVSVDAADGALFADMRGKKVPLTRTKLPFVPHSYKR